MLCWGSVEQARHDEHIDMSDEYKTGILLSCRCSPHIESTLQTREYHNGSPRTEIFSSGGTLVSQICII